MKNMKLKRIPLLRWFKGLLLTAGVVFILLCAIAMTPLPFWAYYRLATKNCAIAQPPTSIILLSGSGIPSESGLIRTYYTARISASFPEALVIIVMPGNLDSTFSSPRLVANELTLRGVNPANIDYENKGRNTHEQALMLAAGKTPDQLNQPITLVTSPEHIRRAVLAFRKVGFMNVSGLPTFENSLDTKLTFNDIDLKGNRFAPDIGENLKVRYQFWNHIKLEVLIIREYLGLMYYKLRGWV